MNVLCEGCKTFHWQKEFTGQFSLLSQRLESCCKREDVKIPLLQAVSLYLWKLLEYPTNGVAIDFWKNIR